MGAARAEMEAIAAQLVEEYPEANRGFVVDVLNYRHEFPDRWRRQLYFLLLGVVLAVLLVACVNVANLLLARGQARRREIAVRSAIGAGRGRVFRQLLTESLVLAGVGGALGLALCSGVLFGIAPTLTGSRPDLVNVLKEGGRGVGGPSRRWLSRTLVVAEIAVSLVLLGGAAVMVRSFLDFQNADPGYDRTRLVAAPIVLPADVDTPERQVDLLARLKTAVQAMPDVTDAALTTAIPEGIQPASDSFTLDAAPPAPGEAHPRAIWLAVSPEYLATLGVPVRRGRFIEPGDRAGTTPVVVINEAMAERYWPDADPIGERLTLGGTSTTIVGVVGDVRQSFISFGQSAEATLYVPLDQRPAPVVTVLARARTDGQALVPLVRRDLLAAESRLTVGQVQSMTEFVAQFHVGLNLFNVILTGFGLLALVLAAVGTYGVLAYDVAQRGHEIGLRLAMGAPRKRILRMFLRRGATLAAIGLAIGAPGVIAIAVFIRSLLVVFSNVQPIVVVAVAAVLLLTTLAASFVPAWRAMRFDPARVLRQE
jgi:putative ABC transport system permease protein